MQDERAQMAGLEMAKKVDLHVLAPESQSYQIGLCPQIEGSKFGAGSGQ